MRKCTNCGGICKNIGNGEYECDCCGSIFSSEDFGEVNNSVYNNTPPAPVQKSAPTPTPAPKTTSQADKDTGADLYDKNVKGVLEITVTKTDGTSCGSGYLITSDGYAITNSHVVSLENGKSCGRCSVKIANERVEAKVVGMGTENNNEHCSNKDLAILKLMRVPVGAKPLKFGESEKVRTGEKLYIIGNSLGDGTCITSGIVSDNNRNGQFMVDCPMNPGNSGGPAFNADGKIIGTCVARRHHDSVTVQGMNYIIPCSVAKDFLRALKITV